MSPDAERDVRASGAIARELSGAVPSSGAEVDNSTVLGQKRKYDTVGLDSAVPGSDQQNCSSHIWNENVDSLRPSCRVIEVLPPPKKSKPAVEPREKRLRRHRATPPAAFHEIFLRATTQRFFVLSRALGGTDECPEMSLEVSGSTGNIYNVQIARQPKCNCPHARKGFQCKHVIFVMAKVLRAKFEYVYQLALMSEELRDIFANCPDSAKGKTGNDNNDKNRKPVDGDCPICFEQMSADPGSEALVWCKASCGQNIHSQCFGKWAATKRQSRSTQGVTCPYCRSVWESEDESAVDLANIKKDASTSEGYVNVANRLGISTRRDYSTYSPWMYGRRRNNYFRRH